MLPAFVTAIPALRELNYPSWPKCNIFRPRYRKRKRVPAATANISSLLPPLSQVSVAESPVGGFQLAGEREKAQKSSRDFGDAGRCVSFRARARVSFTGNARKKRVSFNDRRWSDGGGCRSRALPPSSPRSPVPPPAARSIEHERARLKNRLSATTFKFHRCGDDIFTRSGFVRALNQDFKTRARACARVASMNAIFIKMRKRPKRKYRLNSSSRAYAYGSPL